MKLALLATLVALSACNTIEPPPSCHGPIFALNATRWSPTAADLATPKPIGKDE